MIRQVWQQRLTCPCPSSLSNCPPINAKRTGAHRKRSIGLCAVWHSRRLTTHRRPADPPVTCSVRRPWASVIATTSRKCDGCSTSSVLMSMSWHRSEHRRRIFAGWRMPISMSCSIQKSLNWQQAGSKDVWAAGRPHGSHRDRRDAPVHSRSCRIGECRSRASTRRSRHAHALVVALG